MASKKAHEEQHEEQFKAQANNFIPEVPGFALYRGYLDEAAQRQLAAVIEQLSQQAPFFVPRMPRTGKPFSVRMTNCGVLGWISDQAGGYRYSATHPETGAPWPEMPDSLLAIWQAVTDYPAPPEACLINFYSAQARMGMHKDCDEEALEAPVVSISLGDSALFRLGGRVRKAPSRTLKLCSGDVIVLGGAARLAYHGIDRIYPGTSTVWRGGGRINLTLRRVTRPDRPE